jgi:hypothetical protein
MTNATALEGGERSASRLCRSLPPGKTRYPLYKRLGGPQGRSGKVRKMSLQPGFDPRTVQPVAQSLYRLGFPSASCTQLFIPLKGEFNLNLRLTTPAANGNFSYARDCRAACRIFYRRISLGQLMAHGHMTLGTRLPVFGTRCLTSSSFCHTAFVIIAG